ncbi:IPT/TIG domain-containing protein [Pedobacter nanyangensis]|uniref:IPT/TIG domain-containing protein n=1 Tax=Pedobacter nanyangensis TaxID=1562389 RepID=UPI000DE4DCA9|nr:IPT/TIG domain-containing protein [Pedobacter nanyangensis]
MKTIAKYFGTYFIAAAMMVLFGCKKDKEENTAPPTLTAVTNLTNRSAELQAVDYGDWIMIKGANLKTTQKVDFNGTLAADSLTYAEDNSITVKIPANLTDPINNPITVTTKYGTATLNFKIRQPAPLVEDFSPGAGVPDDEITIAGNYFKGVSGVTINGVNAAIVSSSQTQIKVKVPAGVTYGPVVITTPVGSVTAAKTFGLKYTIYDDGLKNAWSTSSSYSYNVLDLANLTTVRRGTSAMFVNYKGWGAVRYRLVAKFNTTGYTTIKISIFGGTGTDGKKIRVSSTNGSVKSTTYDILIREGKWTDFQIPLINIGSPALIEYLDFQEFSNNASQIYIDDVGFY